MIRSRRRSISIGRRSLLGGRGGHAGGGYGGLGALAAAVALCFYL